MELRHLRYFVAVAETENVSRAALKLHVSQPALSRQIRDLEQELGFELLERSAKSVRLTEAGRVFLNETRAVLQRVDEAVKAALAIAKGGGEIHVGYAPSVTARILPMTLRGFQTAMPDIRVKLHDLNTEEMLSGLREGKLHLALTVRPAKSALRGLRFEELTRDELRLAVPLQHPFTRKRVITLVDAVREPFIAYTRQQYPDYHTLLNDVFSEVKKQPRVVEEHDGGSSLISAVEAGNGVALVGRSMACIAGPRLKLLPLSPAPPPITLGVISRNEELTGSTGKFVECAKRAAVFIEKQA
jgi:DNA-binding transcriptional LysR family regulator